MTTETPASNGEHALRYAAEGLPVFPCHFIRDGGRCSCGKADCDSPGKHPLTRNGCLDATTSAEQVRKWWQVNPQANIGCATGTASGLWVLDVEADGIRDLQELEAAEGDRLSTNPATITGGGGQHHLFKLNGIPITNATRVGGKAIDVRGVGGYVLLPPSNHASGGEYRWLRPLEVFEPEEAPAWLVAFVTSAKSTPISTSTSTSTNGGGFTCVASGFEDAPAVKQGSRHRDLVSLVGKEFARGLQVDAVLQSALIWAAACVPPHDPADVRRVVQDIASREFAKLQQQKAGTPAPKPTAGLIRMSDVQPQSIVWHWPGRIAEGKNHLLAGQPGVGKSFFTLFAAATYSTGGEWPDGGRAPLGDVLLLCCEDGIADTIRPRLDAMGADCSRIHVLQSVLVTEGDKQRERSVALDRDIETLDAVLSDLPDAKAVVIDPISEYLGNTNSHRDAEVRAVLQPLSGLAERHRVAFLNVSHFNKGGAKDGGPALYRAMGSLAFTAQARIAWAFIPDREDAERVLMLPLKCNIARKPPGLAYTLQNGRLEWHDGEVTISAEEALAPATGRPAKARDKAEAWLRQRLQNGGVDSTQLETEAKAAGITQRTLRRVKREIGAQTIGSGSTWVVYLLDNNQETTTFEF